MTRLLLAVAAMLVAGTAAPSGGHHASSSERAGQGRFDALAQIPCTLQTGQPMGRCKAAEARDPGGTATVVVKRPDGRARAIFFEKGRSFGADLSQADGGTHFWATKRGDLYVIEAGNERYEIPEAMVFGG